MLVLVEEVITKRKGIKKKQLRNQSGSCPKEEAGLGRVTDDQLATCLPNQC
jgi:hypothetical protein